MFSSISFIFSFVGVKRCALSIPDFLNHFTNFLNKKISNPNCLSNFFFFSNVIVNSQTEEVSYPWIN